LPQTLADEEEGLSGGVSTAVFRLITAVHDTGDEAELLCHVAAVLANVVSAGCGVLVHEFADVASFGKDVGGVPQLRDFGDDGGAAVM